MTGSSLASSQSSNNGWKLGGRETCHPIFTLESEPVTKEQIHTSYFAKAATIAITALFAIVISSYPNFFFIPPMSAYVWWLSVEQLLFVAGWVLFLVVPIMHNFGSRLVRLPDALVWAAISLYPGSLILIHLSLWFATGDPYLQYLTDNPVFFLTDLAAPLLYWALAKGNLLFSR